ncbi:MAG: SPOR domain-containing protein [Pseudomonadota bacterium]
MRINRVIAVVLMICTLAPPMASAQSLRSAQQSAMMPAEFPPSSYKGRQYVDSRGCVFIRAGIDGIVNWVPRVTRERRLVCGFEPTFKAGVPLQSAPRSGQEPERITIDPSNAQPPSRPESATATTAAVAPVASTPRAVSTAGPETRVVRSHIYQNRQNTTNFDVPHGFRPVQWDDDRLNPRRAERTLVPAQVRNPVIPSGFRAAWDDERLNPRRGVGGEFGETTTDQIWTRTVPRALITQPIDRPVIRPEAVVSTKSESTIAPVYVRVGAFSSGGDAQSTVNALEQSGLPARVAEGRSGSKRYPIVLAGPYPSKDAARSALAQVRKAGYRKARLLK